MNEQMTANYNTEQPKQNFASATQQSNLAKEIDKGDELTEVLAKEIEALFDKLRPVLLISPEVTREQKDTLQQSMCDVALRLAARNERTSKLITKIGQIQMQLDV